MRSISASRSRVELILRTALCRSSSSCTVSGLSPCGGWAEKVLGLVAMNSLPRCCPIGWEKPALRFVFSLGVASFGAAAFEVFHAVADAFLYAFGRGMVID